MSPLRTAQAIASLAATDWDSVSDKPETFPPASHTHPLEDITGLETALLGKASATHTHPLSDLTTSGATTGQVATWNGTAWVPETPTTGGGGVSSWNDLTDKPSTFPPDAHAHGNLTTAGAIGTTSGVPIVTGTGGVLQAGSFGTTAGTFAEGNHTHTGFVTASGGITSIAVVATMPAPPDPTTLYIVTE
jgi:hypothetical protein